MSTTVTKGFRIKPGYLKIAVSFPEQLFKTIAQRAKAEGRSFSAQVVDLCILGEFDLRESDALEPLSPAPAKEPVL